MMTEKHRFGALISLVVLLTACTSDEGEGNSGGPLATDGGNGGAGAEEGGGATTADCPVVVRESDCDQTQRPFVFVHGTFGSGDNFAHVAALLGSNGFCQDRIVAIEYNSLGDQPATNGQLDAAIDQVLADNPGFTQVDLAGHSQGTSHCGTYLGNAAQAAKVANYINFSGRPAVGDVPTLSLSSQKDLGNTAHHATGSNVTEVTFADEDHFAVAASQRAFVEVYKYLRGEEPQYREIQCGEELVTIEGIAETFADNVPIAGRLEIREVTDTPRAEEPPVETLMGGSTGKFGPLQLKRNVPYEFKGYDAAGALVGWQYFTPFKRSNHLVRLLAPSPNPLIAQSSTDHVVRGPNHVALVARWAGGAFRQDLGASLTIDGQEVLTSENAGAGALATPNLDGGVVGLFLNDANMNAQTDLGLYYSGPFIAFSDVYIGTASPALVEVSFTAGSEEPQTVDSRVQISNWPSSDGQILVMFQ